MRLLMRLAFILGVSPCLLGVSQQGSQNQNSQPSDSSAAVGPSQPVITVHGVCPVSAPIAPATEAECEKVITREEFERLLNALNQGGQPASQRARQNLAQSYADYLAFASAARKTGIEETAQFREVMEFIRLRTISDLYRLSLQEKYRTPSAEDIEGYYKQHLPDYERVKLLRILVPREAPGTTDSSQFDKKALAAANSARERAVKGEDLAQIQKDVYSTLGLDSPPPVDLGNYARTNFLENERRDVFALKAGEVSPLETEPRNYVIYKITSKEILPLDQVKAEIARELSQQRFKDAIKAVTDSAHAEFNEQYFGSGMARPPAKVPLPATPPSR